jgi:hypothetical protein
VAISRQTNKQFAGLIIDIHSIYISREKQNERVQHNHTQKITHMIVVNIVDKKATKLQKS